MAVMMQVKNQNNIKLSSRLNDAWRLTIDSSTV